jgi:hypothetical protein
MDEDRHQLLASVRSRRSEICETILARLQSIGLAESPADLEYLEGVRLAVYSAVDHTTAVCMGRDDRILPLPAPLLDQARLAAGRRTPLETVLRRYLAGHAVLGDFVIAEAERLVVPPPLLRRVLGSQAAETDRVLGLISATYREETAARQVSPDRRRAVLVRRLLDGELLDDSGLDYRLNQWHIGVIIQGPDDEGPLASYAETSKFVVSGGDGLRWVWFGSKRRIDPQGIKERLSTSLPNGSVAGIGEPAEGRLGWRMTHAQARAALPLAGLGSGSVARYADVAVVASALSDELLVSSLRSIYLDPLGRADGAGDTLRETARAYLAADRNVTSAAAALGVSRNTVTNRIHTIEKRVGHLRNVRARDFSLALSLDQILASPRTKGSSASCILPSECGR